MNIFIDSSALVKVFVKEPGTLVIQPFVTEALANPAVILTTSAVTKAEMMAAFAALRRGRHLVQRKFEEAVAEFRERWQEFFVPEVTAALIDRSGEIGLNQKLKGADAFQLASALEVETDLFISTDNDLNTAAEDHGLTVWNPMTEPQPKITMMSSEQPEPPSKEENA
jgi:predicted nucleic acid-binding protein